VVVISSFSDQDGCKKAITYLEKNLSFWDFFRSLTSFIQCLQFYFFLAWQGKPAVAVIAVESAVKYSFVLQGVQTRREGQYNAVLTLSRRLCVKTLITAITAIVVDRKKWVYLFVEDQGSRVLCRGSRVNVFFREGGGCFLLFAVGSISAAQSSPIYMFLPDLVKCSLTWSHFISQTSLLQRER